MLKTFFKIILFIMLVLLDGTVLARVPYGLYISFPISALILLLFVGSPLFTRLALIGALGLSLFSILPWYIFAALFMIWAVLIKKISMILFAARSVSSLIVFYCLSYGLFDVLSLIAHTVQDWVLKNPFVWSDVFHELQFFGVGLLAGTITISLVYIVIRYFEKKFQSLFFVRRRGY